MPRRPFLSFLILSLCLSPAFSADDATAQWPEGVVPKGADGKPLNLDFETGDLRNWTAEGTAFEKQPIEGDTVSRRRGDMTSNHRGKFWVGSYEVAGDKPHGTLTSDPFEVTHPWGSFLLGGGQTEKSRVDIADASTGELIFRASGEDNEGMRPVIVDLSKQVGKTIVVRLVDDSSKGWGHVNFDEFRLHAERPKFPVQERSIKRHGLAPDEAVAAMTLPPGFKATLFAAEPDVVQPIAMTIDDRGRLWVCEGLVYPQKRPPGQGEDRVLVFEDTNGDGAFDTKKVFLDKLNLVSGIEVGFGGIWLGQAPELLFFPDKNGDDVPDGPAQDLLDGWHYEDTHETLNSFIWGPDGWLYGCHGVFTHSLVGKPGTPDDQRQPINAGIWRYHPTRHEFEVFAHGTSNPWGVDFNDRGQCFLVCCVIPHLYHVIPGGRSAEANKGDLSKLSDAELAKLQAHPNDFFVRHARRLLQERQSKDAVAPLHQMLESAPTVPQRLRALWALHTLGQPAPGNLLADPDPYVRAWAIQLACEDRSPSDDLVARFAKLAANDPSPVVRLYLASAAGRLDPARRWDILRNLVSHAEDATDHNLPCLYWYALEPLVTVDKIKALKLAAEGKISVLREYVARKMAATAAAK